MAQKLFKAISVFEIFFISGVFNVFQGREPDTKSVKKIYILST